MSSCRCARSTVAKAATAVAVESALLEHGRRATHWRPVSARHGGVVGVAASSAQTIEHEDGLKQLQKNFSTTKGDRRGISSPTQETANLGLPSERCRISLD